MESIKFSIVIPTYNRRESLLQAVKSVLRQEYQNVEVIVVDDGSLERSEADILDLNDSRIKYFWKENEERSIARNFGISKATGDYINFLDSDDIQLQNHLPSAYDLITSSNYPAIVHFGFEYRRDDGSLMSTENFWGGDLKSRFSKRNIFCTNSIFIERGVLEKYKFIHHKDAVFAEDWYLWIRLFLRYRIVFSEIVTTSIKVHHNRSLNLIDPNKAKRSIDIITSRLLDDVIFTSDKGFMRNVLFELYSTVAAVFLNQSFKMEARKYLIKAIKASPNAIFSRRALSLTKSIFAP